MDWGLAKVLTSGRSRRPPTRTRTGARSTEIRSTRGRRTADDAGRQRAGHAGVHAAGAGGRGGRPDRRAERRVRPGGDPVRDPDRQAAVRRGGRPSPPGDCAARAKLDDAFARLDACGAEPELVALCKRAWPPSRRTGRPTRARWRRRWPALRAAAEERAAAGGAGPGDGPRCRRPSSASGGRCNWRWPWRSGCCCAAGGAFAWWQEKRTADRGAEPGAGRAGTRTRNGRSRLCSASARRPCAPTTPRRRGWPWSRPRSDRRGRGGAPGRPVRPVPGRPGSASRTGRERSVPLDTG